MKIRAILIISLITISLSACSFTNIGKEATEAVVNLNSEALRVKQNVENTIKELNEAADAISGATDSIGNAMDAIGDASDQISDITSTEDSEEEETTESEETTE